MRDYLGINKYILLFLVVSVGTVPAFPEIDEESEFFVSPELAITAGLVKAYMHFGGVDSITFDFDDIKPLKPIVVDSIKGGVKHYCCIYYFGDEDIPNSADLLSLRSAGSDAYEEIMEYYRENNREFPDNPDLMRRFHARDGCNIKGESEYFYCYVPFDKRYRGGSITVRFGLPRAIANYYQVERAVKGEYGVKSLEVVGVVTDGIHEAYQLSKGENVYLLDVTFDGNLVTPTMFQSLELREDNYLEDNPDLVERIMRFWDMVDEAHGDTGSYIEKL